jgi:flagellar hook protein FlgE
MDMKNIQRPEELPKLIQKDLEEQIKEESYKAYIHKDKLYLMANLGMKNTAGYDVSFVDINKKNLNTWEATVKVKTPEEKQPLVQMITYPKSMVKISIDKDTMLPKNVVIKIYNNQKIKEKKVKLIQYEG